MLCVRGYITADGLCYDSMVARRVPAGAGAARWWRDAAARGALSRGGAVGALVLLQLERALLQADDAVDDVLGVRVSTMAPLAHAAAHAVSSACVPR